MKFIKPKRLKPGESIIGLIAPSGIVKKEELKTGIALLNQWGFSVKLGKHINAKHGDYSAGSAEQRIEDFQDMIFDKQISAIGCLEGGFAIGGMLKLLKPEIFEHLGKNPKILFGYSDFSLILNALFSRGITSLHAPNVTGLYRRSLTTLKSLKLSLIGELPSEIGPLANWEAIHQGFVQGHLLVSNLEGITDLLGSPFDPLQSGSDNLILAVEEVGEDKSTINRWLEKLLNHSQVEKIKGIIIGRFIKIGEKFYPQWGREISVDSLFAKVFSHLNIPIASLPEFGHTEEEKGILKAIKRKSRERIDFWTLPSGVEVMFKVKSESCRLKFLEKPII
ncbi:LD-carboxypeptidase [Candidatus Dojkabacteria bacterium]|nr:LD-carboxypeptidase [Candidatus Dojkabacteria bacterium]